METSQILVYTIGVVGGGLAGIVLTAILYRLLIHIFFKDQFSLPAILRYLFTKRLFKLPSFSLNVLLNRKNESNLMRIEKPVQAEKTEQQITPAPVVEQLIPNQVIPEPVPENLKDHNPHFDSFFPIIIPYLD